MRCSFWNYLPSGVVTNIVPTPGLLQGPRRIEAAFGSSPRGRAGDQLRGRRAGRRLPRAETCGFSPRRPGGSKVSGRAGSRYRLDGMELQSSWPAVTTS